MGRLPIFAAAGVIVVAIVISTLVIVLPRDEPAQSRTPTEQDFFAVPEEPRTDDGQVFQPDWN